MGRIIITGGLSLILGAMFGWVGFGIAILLAVALSFGSPFQRTPGKASPLVKRHHPGTGLHKQTKAPNWWDQLERGDLPVEGKGQKDWRVNKTNRISNF